jgi:hypothetical protein
MRRALLLGAAVACAARLAEVLKALDTLLVSARNTVDAGTPTVVGSILPVSSCTAARVEYRAPSPPGCVAGLPPERPMQAPSGYG